MIKCRNVLVLLVAGLLAGCMDRKPPPYGRESGLSLPGRVRQVWAVAPAVNLSGQREVDPLLQADILFQQLQQVNGVTVIPVNRVAETYAAMGIDAIGSGAQAAAVCEALGCDALLVPTITIYDPYNPPKFGGALQLFRRGAAGPAQDEQAMVAAGREAPSFSQVVGMYDAANGSVREAVIVYASGRNDPIGPMGVKEYFVNMDRYCGFAYRSLIESLLLEMRKVRS